jgi:hypothetical protein
MVKSPETHLTCLVEDRSVKVGGQSGVDSRKPGDAPFGWEGMWLEHMRALGVGRSPEGRSLTGAGARTGTFV